jgi:hypothetical protein
MFTKGAAFTRTAVGTGIALIALASVAGCDSTKSSTSGAGAPAGAPPTPVKLSPAAAIRSMLSKASAGDQSVSVDGTIVSAAGTDKFTGQEEFGSQFGMKMNMAAAGQPVVFMLIGDTIYMQDAQLSGELNGKQWLEMNLNDLGQVGASAENEMQNLKSQNPVQELQTMLASQDLKDVGPATVDGRQTEHYSGTVDPQTAFTANGGTNGLTAAQVQLLENGFKTAGITAEQIDVWVGSSGLPVEVKTGSTTKAGAVSTDMTFSNWGAPVTLTAPPADQTENLTSLLGGSKG